MHAFTLLDVIYMLCFDYNGVKLLQVAYIDNQSSLACFQQLCPYLLRTLHQYYKGQRPSSDEFLFNKKQPS